MWKKSVIGMSEPFVVQTWFKWMKLSWSNGNPLHVLKVYNVVGLARNKLKFECTVFFKQLKTR